MSIEITQLEILLAVIEKKGFSAAAKQIFKTQSAVSQQIAKLEKNIGHVLVNRSDFTPTHHGEIVLNYAKKILNLHTEMHNYFDEPEINGEVRFGLPEDFANVLLSNVLTEYTRAHPQVLLNIECDLTMNLYEKFKRKEFDLVLLKMSKPEHFPNGVNVKSEPLVWVGDAQLLEREKTVPLILSPSPCVYRQHAIESLNEKHEAWRMVYSSASYAGKVAAVKAGLGFTVLPKNMLTKDMKIITHSRLPALHSTHLSLLKHPGSHKAVASFEEFILASL